MIGVLAGFVCGLEACEISSVCHLLGGEVKEEKGSKYIAHVVLNRERYFIHKALILKS